MPKSKECSPVVSQVEVRGPVGTREQTVDPEDPESRNLHDGHAWVLRPQPLLPGYGSGVFVRVAGATAGGEAIAGSASDSDPRRPAESGAQTVSARVPKHPIHLAVSGLHNGAMIATNDLYEAPTAEEGWKAWTEEFTACHLQSVPHFQGKPPAYVRAMAGYLAEEAQVVAHVKAAHTKKLTDKKTTLVGNAARALGFTLAELRGCLHCDPTNRLSSGHVGDGESSAVSEHENEFVLQALGIGATNRNGEVLRFADWTNTGTRVPLGPVARVGLRSRSGGQWTRLPSPKSKQ